MPEDDDLTSLGRITALARAAAEARPPTSVHAAGRARLVESAEELLVARRDAARPISRSWRIAFATLGVAVLSVLGIFTWRFVQPLGYEVRGSANPARDYVAAPPAASAEVRFSDGTEVTVAPRSRLRIEETKRTGARILVERGTTTAHVKHRGDSSWYFVAGPFEVHVTGTRLTIVWDPERERIDVTLHEGSVEIESPIGPSRYAVTAGHRFSASVREGTVKVDDTTNRDADRTATASKADVEGPAPEVAPPLDTQPAHAAAERTVEKKLATREPVAEATRPVESWSRLVRRGAFREVVSLAEVRGVSSCIATCNAADLRALADAARYTGSAAVARSALLSLRSRFAATEGTAAAFLLGRMAEAGGELGSAERWYSTYLAESPRGEFASDAIAGRTRIAARRGARATLRE